MNERMKRQASTCGVELHKLLVLEGQAGTGSHGITIPSAGVC